MRIALTLALLAISAPLFASREGILTLSWLHVESGGIGESGPIKVSGTQTPDGITFFQVQAFGKSIRLSPAQLKQLEGGQYNLVQLSYESGYQESGGRTLYVRLGKAFNAGEVVSILVVVTEDGNIKIEKGIN